MNFKVVRVDGRVVAYGPNEEWYEPSGVYTIEENAPTIEPTAADQVASLLQANGLVQEWQIDSAMAGMLGYAASQGVDESTLYALNPGYKQAKDLAAQIAALKALL